MPPPCRRCTDHTASLVGNRVLLFGGRTPRTICKPHAYILDLTSREWTEIDRSATDSPQGGRSSHSAVVVGDRVLIFGGKLDSLPADPSAKRHANATASLCLFDVPNMEWVPVTASGGGSGSRGLASLARGAHAAVSTCVPPSMIVLGGCAHLPAPHPSWARLILPSCTIPRSRRLGLMLPSFEIRARRAGATFRAVHVPTLCMCPPSRLALSDMRGERPSRSLASSTALPSPLTSGRSP